MATLATHAVEPASAVTATMRASAAQREWAAIPCSRRLKVIRNLRHALAVHAEQIAASIPLRVPSSLHRNLSDTLVAEVLPLIEACRFLEREAARILEPVSWRGRLRPFWLKGVLSEVHRAPLGTILIIGPANYPLFLPGVQCIQALVAGNAVLWKPSENGLEAAQAFGEMLLQAGLPANVLQVLDSSPQAAQEAIQAGVAKVFLTGHADTGQDVMRQLAATLTPSVMELSGCDAVFVLPGADIRRVSHALAFGLRLNGSATCMAPRRVLATAADTVRIIEELSPMLNEHSAVELKPSTMCLLDQLIEDAVRRGGEIVRDGRGSRFARPTILMNVAPGSTILRTDIFAPVLSFCRVESEAAALTLNEACPYALTAAIFGPEDQAVAMARLVNAGTVLINDLVVATADPRVPFGGRGRSGFGVTRGREGLLEMTAPKTIIRQRNRSLRAYAPTTHEHVSFFAGYISAVHGGNIGERRRGLKRLFAAARKIDRKPATNNQQEEKECA